VAEDPGQIRQAIEETRAEIAGTVQALGEKADVKGRLNQVVAEKTSELRGRATELQESARQALPPAAQSKADSAIGSARRVAGTVMSDPAKKRTAAWVAGAVVALLVLRRRRGRR
jgi:MYXO-CTERM domain-containing protein